MSTAAAGGGDGGPRTAAAGGLLWGLVGVLAFSLTLPMTRVAVARIDPSVVAFGRMAIAGLVAIAWLAVTWTRRPGGAELRLAAASALGVVIGFPLLSTLALRSTSASHAAIVSGLLPFATAVFGVVLHRERLAPRFWAAAVAGSALVVGYAWTRGGGRLSVGDLWMLGAVVAGAFGYATGARLAMRIGGMRAILWSLATATPFTLPIAAASALNAPPHADAATWAAFGYVTLVSQLLGFFAWYNGLAKGGIARVGQVQLLQVFFTIGFATLAFGEDVAPSTWWFAAAVVATIAWGRSSRAAATSAPRWGEHACTATAARGIDS